MREGIHPNYKKLKITIGTDVFETNSTIESGELLMDIDFRKHPAWTKDGVNVVNQSNKNIEKFNKRFPGLVGRVGKK